MKLLGTIALALALSCAPALAQTSPGTSPLSGAKGGTNNSFMQFTGPASSMKTYTLPNATDTIATLAAIQTFSAAKTFNSSTLLLAGSSSGSTTLNASAAASGTLTLPAATDTLVGRSTTDTLTNKTLTSPVINSPTMTTPSLGVATATSINKVAITAPATSATLTIPDGVTLTGPAASGTAMTLGNAETVTGAKSFNDATVILKGSTSGTTTLKSGAAAGTSVITLPIATDTLVGKATTDTFTNKTFDTAGTGNSLSIAGVAVTANNGTGAIARATSPVFVTPTLGAATATSINGNTFTAGTYTLTGGAGKTLTFSNSLTLAGTDATTLTFQGTDTYVGRATTDTLTNKTFDTAGTGNSFSINGLAATANTGTGAVVRASSPALVTPALGTPSSATLTNATGLPISTGVSGLGSGVATALATPSSANLATAVTDETGSGALVFGTNATLSAPTISGVANFSGARKDSTQSAPAQITSNQNDYNPSSVICTTSSTLLINSDAARDITGFAGGVAGCDLFLFNNGSFSITLKDGSASSTAANRLDLGADFVLGSKAAAHLKYDGTASRWRNTTGSGTGGGGSGTVTQVVCGTNLAGGTITTSGQCDLDQTAWTTFSPSASCSGGTFTVNSARYKNWGKAVFWSMDATISSGSCSAGNMTFTMPLTALNGAGGGGFEYVTQGVAVPCWITASSATMTCRNSAPFASTSRFNISGLYERN